MADKMIAISSENAELIRQIQLKTNFPVTIKAVVHVAIAELHKKVMEASA